MSLFLHRTRKGGAILLLFLWLAALLPAQQAPPLPGDQRFPAPPQPATAAPARPITEEGIRIPRRWLLVGGTLAGLMALYLLWHASRTWRRANLFDRSYRLPVPGTAALRLGGERSGGAMATVKSGRDG